MPIATGVPTRNLTARPPTTQAEGEPLVEVLAGAATVDLPAPADGVLAEKSAAVGDVLAVGQQLATIESEW